MRERRPDAHRLGADVGRHPFDAEPACEALGMNLTIALSDHIQDLAVELGQAWRGRCELMLLGELRCRDQHGFLIEAIELGLMGGVELWRPNRTGVTRYGWAATQCGINRRRPVQIVAYAVFGTYLGRVAWLFEALAPANAGVEAGALQPGAPVDRLTPRGPNFSFIAGGVCGCAWLCANCRRIAETARVRSP